MPKASHGTRVQKAAKPGFRGRVWIDGPEGTFIGYGRVVLLERIIEHGSITKAAISMKMAYRHAWDLVDSMNRQAKTPFVELATGGKGGGGAHVTPRADVFGLGAILYVLLAEGPPPEDRAMLFAGVTSVARPLRAICEKALAPDPESRYDSVQSLALDVARFRAGEAVEAHRESAFDRAARFGRTYRTPILLVLAYVVMRALVAWFGGR